MDLYSNAVPHLHRCGSSHDTCARGNGVFLAIAFLNQQGSRQILQATGMRDISSDLTYTFLVQTSNSSILGQLSNSIHVQAMFKPMFKVALAPHHLRQGPRRLRPPRQSETSPQHSSEPQHPARIYSGRVK